MIIALLALVIALGGTSYAAFKLPAGSVGTRQLRSAAVTSSKLGSGAVTTLKLARGSVTSTRVQAGAGVSLVYKSGMVPVQPNKQAAAFTQCPAGMNAVGGGETPDDAGHVLLVYSAPYNSKRKASSGPADSWVADVSNNDAVRAHNFGVYAVCITAGMVH